MASKDKLIADTATELKVQNPADIAKKAAQLQGEIAGMKKEIESLNSKLAGSKINDVLASAISIGSVKLVTYVAEGMEIDAARSLSDKIKAENADMVAVLAVKSGDKLNFIAVAGKDAVAAGAHAGKIVGAVAAVTGGKGGGRPDNAMAGGRDASKVAEALDSAKATLEGMLK
jgi:alanyl-tRNA synthetase